MPLSEFELIEHFFASSDMATVRDQSVVLGIGDDAAILRVPPEHDLVVSIDTLVGSVHFPVDMVPAEIGWRALAVNLSDLAAMGADPLWFTLALTLPTVDQAWLQGFCEGLASMARQAPIVLVGGDTTRGPLSITIQVHGAVPRAQALRRDSAQIGDRIYVSGHPGNAALGLRRLLQGESSVAEPAARAFRWPQPRLGLGRRLRHIASAAIDVSDGLLADAAHIGERSGVGLVLDAARLPLGAELLALGSREDAMNLCLAGGDDYELCFTAAPEHDVAIQMLAGELNIPCTCIGAVESGAGAHCRGFAPAVDGYQHFGARSNAAP